MADDLTTVDTSGLSVRHLPPLRIRILRLRKTSETVLDQIAAVLGARLPQNPNTVARAEDGTRIAWLSPGDWMIVGGPDDGEIVAAADGLFHLADVSDGRTSYEVAGERARDFLAKGTSLDLHPGVFTNDQCAQTLFAQMRVLIERLPADAAYLVHLDRTYDRYFRDWTRDAAKEFSIQELNA